MCHLIYVPAHQQTFIQTLKRRTLLMHGTIVSLDTEPDAEERNSSSQPTTPKGAGIPTSTVVSVVCLLRRVLHRP